MLSNENKYNDTGNLLIDTTYEIIYRFLELIDGYGINKKTNIHDMCKDFLLHTEI